MSIEHQLNTLSIFLSYYNIPILIYKIYIILYYIIFSVRFTQNLSTKSKEVRNNFELNY